MADHTITFLPRRLNATPIVFRGMTGREVGLMAIAGLIAGIPLGVALMFVPVVGAFAMVPTGMALACGLAVWFGGGVMRRLRRGRPESWLYRRIQWAAARRGLGGKDLIVRSATHRPGRSKPRRKS